jgi:hypothetical protein
MTMTKTPRAFKDRNTVNLISIIPEQNILATSGMLRIQFQQYYMVQGDFSSSEGD